MHMAVRPAGVSAVAVTAVTLKDSLDVGVAGRDFFDSNVFCCVQAAFEVVG
jgi:hypothetical protein